MEGWTHLPRSEAMQKARYRTRHSSPTRRAIEEEIQYVHTHPEESVRIENLGTAKFDNWYKTMRGVLLRVARGINAAITVRQEEGQAGLVFWKATAEELQTRPNPQRRPTTAQKALGVADDLAEGADEGEIDEAATAPAFACADCGKGFDTKAKLNSHKRMAKHSQP
jgi:hypothetical protein